MCGREGIAIVWASVTRHGISYHDGELMYWELFFQWSHNLVVMPMVRYGESVRLLLVKINWAISIGIWMRLVVFNWSSQYMQDAPCDTFWILKYFLALSHTVKPWQYRPGKRRHPHTYPLSINLAPLHSRVHLNDKFYWPFQRVYRADTAISVSNKDI